MIEVVGAVIVRDGAVLACRRAAHKSEAGLWEFPGGKVTPGESPELALVREIREELGVAITVGGRLARSVRTVGPATIALTTYWAALVGEVPIVSSDHDRLVWLRPDVLGQLDWCRPDLATVDSILGVGSTRGAGLA